MNHYSVRWAIDIFAAEGPRDAAEQALKIQRDPLSIATVFDVEDEDGQHKTIDLQEE